MSRVTTSPSVGSQPGEGAKGADDRGQGSSQAEGSGTFGAPAASASHSCILFVRDLAPLSLEFVLTPCQPLRSPAGVTQSTLGELTGEEGDRCAQSHPPRQLPSAHEQSSQRVPFLAIRNPLSTHLHSLPSVLRSAVAASELGAAARDGDVAKVRLLVASGADCSVAGAQPRTARTPSLPCMQLRTRVLNSLLTARWRFMRADESGMTPLMWAVDRGQTEAAAALLDSGADANATDEDG